MQKPLPPDTTFDPWALGRLHAPDERDDMIGLGFPLVAGPPARLSAPARMPFKRATQDIRDALRD